MIATLAFPQSHRHPAWFLACFLPVLPFLSWMIHGDATNLSAVQWGAGMLLLGLGTAASLAIPQLLVHLGPAARKEAELLRDPWLAAVFAAQLPLLLPVIGKDVDLLAFACSAALIAAIPFGAEFHQRTLASLLSQPVDRAVWWSLKNRLLGTALALHGLAFLLAHLAVGRPSDPPFVLALVVVSVVAFGTTTAWTLLTRALIPGLVFSVAAPIAFLLLGSFALSQIEYSEFVALGLGWDRTDLRFAGLLTAIAAGPVYALAGYQLGSRRWRALEAPDAAVSHRSVGPSVPAPALSERHHPSTGSWPRFLTQWRRSRLAMLTRKEFRLQSQALVALAICLVFAVAAEWMSGVRELRDVRTNTVACLLLLSGVTILLAGATSIAEERSLGTLDSQVLIPVSRGLQAAIKLLPIALISVVAASIAFQVVVQPYSRNPSEWYEMASTLAFATVGILAASLLASSGSPNTLRAVIATIAALIVGAALAGITLNVVGEEVSQLIRNLHASALSNPAPWFEELESSAVEPSALVPPNLFGYRVAFAAIMILPALVALRFAWTNFRTPAGASHLLSRQFGICGATLVGALLVTTTLELNYHRTATRHEILRTAQAFLTTSRTFSSAERALWEKGNHSPFSSFTQLEIEPFPNQDVPRVRGIKLPLSAHDRRLILHRAKLPEPLRNALRQEGIAKGEDVDTPPSPPPPRRKAPPARRIVDPESDAGAVPMNPQLMRRYGIVPKSP